LHNLLALPEFSNLNAKLASHRRAQH